VKLRLHNYWRSSASHRVRIALGLKSLPWEYVVVDILKGGRAGGGGQHDDGYKAINPMAQVPTLEITEDDGRVHTLTQSLPIIEYLDERFVDPPILPVNLEARAHARAVAEMINSGIQPLQNLSTTNQVTAMGGDVKIWVQGFIARGLAAIEDAVAGNSRFCVGDAPTIADCCLVPQVHSARRFGVDLAAFPRISAIAAACEDLPAFAAALPDRQPDAIAAR
jgi:maleylpyruvate isomerase